jgi:hypothetical protein
VTNFFATETAATADVVAPQVLVGAAQVKEAKETSAKHKARDFE